MNTDRSIYIDIYLQRNKIFLYSFALISPDHERRRDGNGVQLTGSEIYVFSQVQVRWKKKLTSKYPSLSTGVFGTKFQWTDITEQLCGNERSIVCMDPKLDLFGTSTKAFSVNLQRTNMGIYDNSPSKIQRQEWRDWSRIQFAMNVEVQANKTEDKNGKYDKRGYLLWESLFSILLNSNSSKFVTNS